ncbi:MAG: glycosyltransferase family 2 protein [Lachnospiraceae bacterium]|nr:glycosyltransferase family 2 protein [Lachnospiraceae bacterium]
MEDTKAVPVISVLMPAYNVEKYIAMSIASVLNQTMSDFELIIINDGSTDATGENIEKYKNMDTRIRVYHRENRGLASARNMAVSYARGEYVTFIDSDDTVKEDYLECLYENAVKYNADVAVASYYSYVEAENVYRYVVLEQGYEVKSFTGQEAYQNYYNPVNGYNIAFVVAWGKLFKRELLTKLHFPNGKLHEDSFTIYKAYLLSDKIIYVNKNLYMYRVRENSIMSTKWSRERLRDFMEQHEERLSLLAVLGIEITEDNKADYIASLKKCIRIALINGYIDEYELFKQKLSLIEQVKKG